MHLKNTYRRGLSTRVNAGYKTAMEQEATEEWNPNTPPVLTNKGTLMTVGGGLPQFKSTTGTEGGTILMEVDPVTGTTTIRGGLVAQQTLDLGTITNTAIAGTARIIGTLTNNTLINNGTWNNGTFGTPAITGGSLNSAVLGTPNATGGTHNNAFLGSLQTAGGTIGTPTITGTPTFTTNAGSGTLSADGQFAIQTFGGSALLAIRLGTQTYQFTPSGTFT